MTAWFLDSSVLLTSAGDVHPERDRCRALLATSGEPDVRIHVSVEAIQEFLFHRMRRTSRARALSQTRGVLHSCLVHPVDADVLDRSLDLIATTSIRGRDAVIAATALEAGFDSVVSLDPDFDDIPGLRRLAPADALG